jgi:fumarylacetoacetate (FAA) hydrolase family protein
MNAATQIKPSWGLDFDPQRDLPADWRSGRFLGRIDAGAGPTPVLLQGGVLHDLSALAPTVAHLVESGLLEGAASHPQARVLGPLESLGLGTAAGNRMKLLAPVDLQCVKAAGVTFAVSMLERVIEEAARGEAGAALEVRARLEARIGSSLRTVVPGSAEAMALKATLVEEKLWSQYLEVAIGPDAEVFTKVPVLASMGWGVDIGIRSDSTWNNPEPEVVLLADSRGRCLGATLGNDVNLRDFEGRSALLLSKAKDNNASCAIGPFIRLFDTSFSMADVERDEVRLRIDGPEGYLLEGSSQMSQISRSPTALLGHAMSEHQYPDGFVLFLGTMFAPTQDRDAPGHGFTHHVGDTVTVSSPKLGTLFNRVNTSKDAAPWTLGLTGLFNNLARRGLLKTSDAR